MGVLSSSRRVGGECSVGFVERDGGTGGHVTAGQSGSAAAVRAGTIPFSILECQKDVHRKSQWPPSTSEQVYRGATRHNRDAVDVSTVQDILKRRRIEQAESMCTGLPCRMCTVCMGDEPGRTSLAVSLSLVCPGLVWFLEDPMGSLERRSYMAQYSEGSASVVRTTHYCAYGRTYKKPTRLWTNMFWWVPQGRTGTGQCLGVPAPVHADGRDETHQLSSSKREAGRRQRVNGGKVVSPSRADAGAGGGVPVEGGRQPQGGSKLQLE